MLFSVFILVLLLWVIHRQFKMRRILILSRKLRNKYVALPMVGHGLMFLGSCEDRMKTLQKFGREAIESKHGVTSFWLGSQFYAMTCDATVAGRVSKIFLKKTELAEISRHLMGNGSIFAPVQIWRPRRKILAPTFSPKNLNCFVEIFAEQSTIMNTCLKSKAGSGTFSIWNNITSCTMDSICRTVLGIEMNSQTQSLHPFLAAFDKYSKLVAARVSQPWLHWDLLYKLLPVYQEAEKYRQIIHDFIDDTIRQKKISLENELIHTGMNTYSNSSQSFATTTTEISTFLHLLLTSSNGSNGYTDLEIREEILVLVLAGTDTSAVGASFTIVMLSRHLSVQEKAYEEVREIFGNSKRPITHEDLSRLKYIEALIKETLRLYPPVPIIMRENEEDTELPSGVTLLAGTCTAINIWGIHRNPQYWGADAEEFNPDRFLNGTVTPQSAYMVFSYGPRNCLGYRYAMMSMKVVVATLLRDYKVLPPSNMSTEDLSKPLRVQFAIMMKDVDNFKVRLEHRT